MIIATTLASLDGPRNNHGFPLDFTGAEEEKMSDHNRRVLTDLIFQKVQDENERERWLSQINDEMTKADSEELIFSFLTTKI